MEDGFSPWQSDRGVCGTPYIFRGDWGEANRCNGLLDDDYWISLVTALVDGISFSYFYSGQQMRLMIKLRISVMTLK